MEIHEVSAVLLYGDLIGQCSLSFWRLSDQCGIFVWGLLGQCCASLGGIIRSVQHSSEAFTDQCIGFFSWGAQ